MRERHCSVGLTCTILKKLVQAKKKMQQVMENAITGLEAEAQDAQTGEAAAVDAAGGQRRSDRIRTPVDRPTENLCEWRKQQGVLQVPGAKDLPDQGCFCAATCPGHGGACTNQVPEIKTEDNVFLIDSFTPNFGKFLVAAQDIPAGTILTLFEGVLVKLSDHEAAYNKYSEIHDEQQHTLPGEQKFEYAAQTGSTSMRDSQAWVIPPQDIPLLQQKIIDKRLQNTVLHNLVKNHQTSKHGLAHYAQHTCCDKHVNAYLFPICIMDSALPGKKRSRNGDEEVMDVQALAIRAQKDIRQEEDIWVHYVGSGKKGNLWFDCRCCKCQNEGDCGL